MLVLRRKPDESLVINGIVTVSILAVEGDRVKVGIDAPPDVSVMRSELRSLSTQQARLRRKQAELAREANPERRARLQASIAQMQQAIRQAMQPVSTETRQE